MVKNNKLNRLKDQKERIEQFKLQKMQLEHQKGIILDSLEKIQNGQFHLLRKNEASRFVAKDVLQQMDHYKNLGKPAGTIPETHKIPLDYQDQLEADALRIQKLKIGLNQIPQERLVTPVEVRYHQTQKRNHLDDIMYGKNQSAPADHSIQLGTSDLNSSVSPQLVQQKLKRIKDAYLAQGGSDLAVLSKFSKLEHIAEDKMQRQRAISHLQHPGAAAATHPLSPYKQQNRYY